MNERNYTRKAKRVDNGEWVTGYLLRDGVTGQYFIHASGNSVNESDKVNEEGCLRFVAFEINPDTICEPTGITNDNGKLIWENDIIRYDFIGATGKVVYLQDRGWFAVEYVKRGIQYYDERLWKFVDVIGNVFDNPELLEVEA